MRKYAVPIAVGAVCLVVGYFFGREHIKYEIRSAITDAFTGALGGTSSLAEDNKKKRGPTPEALAYAGSIEIYDLAASRTSSSNWSAPRKPRIDGKIKNNGNRTLKSLSIRFYFHDDKGNTVFESTDTEYFGIEGLMGSDKPLLRPGYIAELFHLCENCPSEAVAKPSKIEIVDVEFAD